MTVSKGRTKPLKPHGSPLTPMSNGQWGKRIRGRLFYFGIWEEHDAALERYRRQADDLHAGRTPRVQASAGDVTTEYLCNAFLSAKRVLLSRGEITGRTFGTYFDMAQRAASWFGKGRSAEALGPLDFSAMLEDVSKTWGPTRRRNFVGFIRMLFKWAVDSDLLDKQPKYGPDFKAPSKRIARKKKRESGGADFSAAIIRKTIKASGPQMKAMILLGVNGGFGNNDCAELREDVIDLKGKLIDWPRPKTEIHRIVPLWPETVTALKAVLASRRRPRLERDQGLVFITKYGNAWAGRKDDNDRDDPIAKEFRKLLNAIGDRRKGVGFYGLRRTFRTVAGETLDTEAINLIMGHATPGIGPEYVQRIELKRLKGVSDHVRHWLFKR
jgi:integrase